MSVQIHGHWYCTWCLFRLIVWTTEFLCLQSVAQVICSLGLLHQPQGHYHRCITISSINSSVFYPFLSYLVLSLCPSFNSTLQDILLLSHSHFFFPACPWQRLDFTLGIQELSYTLSLALMVTLGWGKLFLWIQSCLALQSESVTILYEVEIRPQLCLEGCVCICSCLSRFVCIGLSVILWGLSNHSNLEAFASCEEGLD